MKRRVNERENFSLDASSRLSFKNQIGSDAASFRNGRALANQTADDVSPGLKSNELAKGPALMDF